MGRRGCDDICFLSVDVGIMFIVGYMEVEGCCVFFLVFVGCIFVEGS